MKYHFVLFVILILCVNVFASNNAIITDSRMDVNENNKITSNITDEIKTLIQNGDHFSYNYPDSALHYYYIALDIVEKESMSFYESKVLSRIGNAKYVLGEYDQALDKYIKALNIRRNSNNKKGIASSLNNIAMILNILEQHEAAIENHRNSALLCIEIGDSTLLASNYFNIGLINLDLNNYDTALLYANKSLQINNLINEKLKLYEINTLKGNIYLKQGKLLQAQESFLKVINKTDTNNKWELSYALAGLSLTEQKLGNIKKSILYGENSIKLVKKINAKWHIQNIANILSASYALNEDFENAYNYYKEYKTYSDSVFNKEKESRINYLLLKQEDFEYIILAKENKINTQIIQKKNNQILLFTLGLLLFALITISLYRTNFLKTKLNNALNIKNEEIARKNKELIKLSATKDTFFRIIGHDLKSPMSTVVSFTDLLENNYDDLSKKEIIEYISITKKSALDTIELLENLIELAKAQTGITIAKPTRTDILKLINNSLSFIRSIIIAKNINLIIEIDKDLTAVLDIYMTASIIRNLLTNAVKFTHKNGKIIINAQKDDKSVLFSITDSGIGMSIKKLESLFKIEYAKSSLGTNNEKGTGIGLILCKELTHKQGGEIWAESELGIGSSFYVRL